jgi:hypothetical protein
MAKNIFFFLIIFIISISIGSKSYAEETQPSKAELEKVANKLIDPLSDLWFIFMTNYITNIDDKNSDKRYSMNQYLLQPVMPITIEKDKIIVVNRPTFQINTLPNLQNGGYNTHVSNFTWASALGYKTDFGLIYGVGPLLTLPAYNDFSSRNFKTGGMALMYYIHPKFATGFNYSHFKDLETRDEALYTNSGVLQYVFNYRITPLFSIISSSQVEITYTPYGAEYNLPVGLAFGRTFYLGKIPASLQVGYQYVLKNTAIIEAMGLQQNHRLSLALTTVIPNLFKLDKFR